MKGEAATIKFEGEHTHPVLMVNNLGGTTPLEIFILLRRAIENMKNAGIPVERVVVGSLMTSLEMAGFSFSLFAATASQIAALDTPCSAPAWPGVSNPADKVEPKEALVDVVVKASGKGPTLSNENAEKLKGAVVAMANALIDSENELTELDTKTGDGDCGQAFSRGSKALLQNIENYSWTSPVDLLRGMADTVRDSMGGSSGGFYDLALRAAANRFETCAEGDVASTVAAFEAGIGAIQRYGKAELGDRTMLDSLVPAAAAMKSKADIKASLEAGVAAASAGSKGTADLKAKAGRSSYMN